jgi:hypothetical protein
LEILYAAHPPRCSWHIAVSQRQQRVKYNIVLHNVMLLLFAQENLVKWWSPKAGYIYSKRIGILVHNRTTLCEAIPMSNWVYTPAPS